MKAPLIIIPSRLGSTRLLEKPLEEIGGIPLIVHAWQQAVQADLGPVVVACDDLRILRCVEKEGAKAVLTDRHHPTGSDRVFQALTLCDPHEEYDFIINLQGDLALFPFKRLEDLIAPLEKGFFMSTFVKAADPEEACTRVKVEAHGEPWLTCTAFNRNPFGPFVHMGVYGFTKTSLRKFASWSQTPGEKALALEQVRALENSQKIAGILLNKDDFFLNIDTPQDLIDARQFFQKKI